MTNNIIKPDQYYHDLGVKCGLEIHQQILTDKKLFCRCKAHLHKDTPTATILRHMRPTLSELGKYDGTALMEFKTKKNVIYQLYNDTVCTYEMDDTPPFRLNKQALDIALEIALLLNCHIVDEIHISRKQYLDGSIPTGFQRTGIIGVEGSIPYKDRNIGIIQLGLEEDACREISDIGHKIVFKTDRLSIPLVEVVTHPDIRTPTEAEEVARLLGRLLRSTGKVRRGLGSIRQDVNVSVKGSTRIELKGIPKLQYIANAVAHEVQRQKALLDIRDELRLRGVTDTTFHSESRNVTALLKRTKNKQLKEVLKKKGIIYGVVLRLFGGIVDISTQPHKTFYDELAGRVRVIACLDVMPNIVTNTHFESFGLTKKEINELEKLFNVRSTDAIVLVWGDDTDVKTAVEEIKIRAVEATQGVPSETRQVFPDGSNDFERILPGPDRMYPDTDTPPTAISEDALQKIRSMMREPVWVSEQRLEKLGLPPSLVTSLSISPRLTLFDKIVQELHVNPILVAVAFEEQMKSLRRKGKNIDAIHDDKLYETFKHLASHTITKEAIPAIFEYLADHPTMTVQGAVHELKIKPLTVKELHALVDETSTHLFNPHNTYQSTNMIMGEVMKVARHRIDGKLVSDAVQKKLDSLKRA